MRTLPLTAIILCDGCEAQLEAKDAEIATLESRLSEAAKLASEMAAGRSEAVTDLAKRDIEIARLREVISGIYSRVASDLRCNSQVDPLHIASAYDRHAKKALEATK